MTRRPYARASIYAAIARLVCCTPPRFTRSLFSWGKSAARLRVVIVGMEQFGWGREEGGWRKGPWTAQEDKLLLGYVRQQGEGRWNSVAKLTGAQ